MHIIGIVGTAKNTGKTTTLAALIEEAGRRRRRIGVTGIGYDGEEIDTITGLPKPRLMLQPGTIVATSEQCLLTTSAGYAVIKKTGAETALGAVVIVEILRAGLMVLAGPNTKRLLRELIAELGTMELDALFVDGSLNRIAAMSVVDTMVFTTGASRSVEILFLSEEARAICGVFNGTAYPCDASADGIELQDATGRIVGMLPMRSLFDVDDARRVLDAVEASKEPVVRIVIPNMVSLPAFEYASQRLRPIDRAGSTIIISDPTIALLAGEPIAMFRWMQTSSESGVSLGYRHAIRVAAMTVNPFYPLQHDHSFAPAYIDKDCLLAAVGNAVEVPVYNIKESGASSALFDRCMEE
jgi:hypothetical protein